MDDVGGRPGHLSPRKGHERSGLGLPTRGCPACTPILHPELNPSPSQLSGHDGPATRNPDFQIILEPGRQDLNYWRDLWRYRELFQVLAWRDVAVRYKQTVIGAAWAIVRPFLAMLVFTFIFGRVAKLPAPEGVPYALMVFAAMLPWQFFATALGEASNSLIANSNLISKVYFPRLIVPTATVVVSVVDLLVSCTVLAALMLWYRFLPSWQVVLLPAFVLLGFLAGLGPSLWITALNVKYRDFRYIIPFLVQFGLYVSPVGFSTEAVPEKWRLLYALNPMVAVIDGFRWALLAGHSPFAPDRFVVGLAVTAFFLWAGLRQFRRMEKSFADLI